MERKKKEQFIFGAIFLFANQLQAIADRSSGEITLKQWFLLIIIHSMENKSPTINKIADFMGYTRQNAKKMLVLLENKGYVVIQKSPTDSRALSISLTEKSMEYFAFSEKTGNQFLDKVFQGIEENQINEVYDTFLMISENINLMNDRKERYL